MKLFVEKETTKHRHFLNKNVDLIQNKYNNIDTIGNLSHKHNFLVKSLTLMEPKIPTNIAALHIVGNKIIGCNLY